MPVVDSALLFGRCISTTRRDMALTQEQFARRLGITRSALAQVETGRSTLSFYTLMRLGQQMADDRIDQDATAVIELFHESAIALQERGVRVFNRLPRTTDDILETHRIDRVVNRVFDDAFREDHRFIRIVRFTDDDD